MAVAYVAVDANPAPEITVGVYAPPGGDTQITSPETKLLQSLLIPGLYALTCMKVSAEERIISKQLSFR